ncbi:unnamed protein product, partial [Nesidiocoris tenuis]
ASSSVTKRKSSTNTINTKLRLRLKSPSLAGACRITMQKLLYFVVFLATIIKGAYFTSPKKERVAKAVDVSQLNQSRLGLLSQALFLFAVCFFLSSETTKHIWKDKYVKFSHTLLSYLKLTASDPRML